MSLKPLEQKEIEVTWKAWKLPENAKPPAKPEGYGEAAKQFLSELINETKLTIRPPTQKRDTYLAHIGAKFAKEKGLFSEYHRRIFEAVWNNDENIENVGVLSAIAKEVGLDPVEFEQALKNNVYENQVKSDFQDAAKDEIWTIPSYIGSASVIQVHHFKDIPNVDQLETIV